MRRSAARTTGWPGLRSATPPPPPWIRRRRRRRHGDSTRHPAPGSPVTTRAGCQIRSRTWRPVGDRQVRGQVNVSVSGGLGSGRGSVAGAREQWLATTLHRERRGQNPVGWVANSRSPSESVWLRDPCGAAIHHHLDRRICMTLGLERDIGFMSQAARVWLPLFGHALLPHLT